MDKEFIPYEQALALTELGFDEPCFGFYLNGKVRLDGKIENCLSQERVYYVYRANCLSPTFSQAFRWFREKYNLFFNIYSSDPARTDVYWNIFIFGKTKNRQDVKLEYVSMIYEETELECLKKLISIVKERNNE